MQPTIPCEAAEAAGRILAAIEAGDAPRLASELDRAAHACRGPWPDSDAEERLELLAAVVESLRREAQCLPCSFEPYAALLRHLAGPT